MKDPKQKILESQPGYRKLSYESQQVSSENKNMKMEIESSDEKPSLNSQLSNSSQCLLSQMLMTRQNNSSCVSRSLPKSFSTVNIKLEEELTNLEGTDEVDVLMETLSSVDSGWSDNSGSFRKKYEKRNRPKAISPFFIRNEVEVEKRAKTEESFVQKHQQQRATMTMEQQRQQQQQQ